MKRPTVGARTAGDKTRQDSLKDSHRLLLTHINQSINQLINQSINQFITRHTEACATMSLSQTEKEHLSRFLKILTDGAVRQLILEESSRVLVARQRNDEQQYRQIGPNSFLLISNESVEI